MLHDYVVVAVVHAPMSNATIHDNHEKNQLMGFLFFPIYEYRALLGAPPELRYK